MSQDQPLTEVQVTTIARKALKAEITAAAIYTRLAKKYRDQERSGKLEEFAQAEQHTQTSGQPF